MYSRHYPNIFRPLKLGPLTIKNRIEVAPAVPILATEDGYVSEALIAYTQELARSGAGVVTVGDSAVEFLYAKEHLNMLNLGDYKVLPGLSRLVDCIHRHGAVASIEINHGGRFTAPMHLGGRSPIGPSAIPSRAALQFEGDKGRQAVPVREMSQEEIARVTGEFATAAKHCAQAGFKMIMLHGGHGHLISAFFSTLSNKRNDIYGGSFENRCRFPLEVLRAIRAAVGDDMVIEYRISADEIVKEGVHFDDMVEFVKEIRGYVNLVHVSTGNICEPSTQPMQIQPTYVPRGINAILAQRMKEQTGVPVTAIGSITMEMAEQLLEGDKVDMVAMMRNFLADTRLVKKYKSGRADQVRPCIRCDTCTQSASRFYPVVCAVNPMIGRETEFTRIEPAAEKKRVMVVGGGPAGMQAALTAAQRGHQVTLFEKTRELGGNLIPASAPVFKADMRIYLDWLKRQVMENGDISLRLGAEAKPGHAQELGPDCVIVAIGSRLYVPDIPGVEKCLRASDVLLGAAKAGENVLVIGAGLTGLEAALHLARKGKSVTVSDMLPRREFGHDCNGIAKIALFQLLEEAGVSFIGDVLAEAITDEGAMVIDRAWKRYLIPADSVVLSAGFLPLTGEAEAFLPCAPEVIFVGDCNGVANLKQAVHQGFNAAFEI